jgi:hypothetical protein
MADQLKRFSLDIGQQAVTLSFRTKVQQVPDAVRLRWHDKLLANTIAQPEALLFGQSRVSAKDSVDGLG